MKLVSWSIAFTLLIFAVTASAETKVVGRYLAGAGGEVRIQLTIEAPPPTAFIVLQHLPPGVKMMNSSPAPTGFQQNGATVKWLFKQPRSGTMILAMQLSRPVPENQLVGEISYRHPRNGALASKKINF